MIPPRYLVITPVKDEDRNVERTLRSMVNQTLKPVLWIIVDDGSSDRTADIVESYVRNHDFIRLLRNPCHSPRQTGIAEVLAFNTGLEHLKGIEYDCIVKLDGDLSFAPDYFDKLMGKFAANARLGIASGIYQEDRGDGWQNVGMPDYHAAGASKVVRRECFTAIRGFIAERGWDTVDEIRAMALGWETTHFPELKMQHWKPEGTGMGTLRTCYMHGEIYYRTGGGWVFFAIKALNRLLHSPVVAGGSAMVCGFAHALLKRREMLVTHDEARLYKALLNARLFGKPRR